MTQVYDETIVKQWISICNIRTGCGARFWWGERSGSLLERDDRGPAKYLSRPKPYRFDFNKSELNNKCYSWYRLINLSQRKMLIKASNNRHPKKDAVVTKYEIYSGKSEKLLRNNPWLDSYLFCMAKCINMSMLTVKTSCSCAQRFRPNFCTLDKCQKKLHSTSIWCIAEYVPAKLTVKTQKCEILPNMMPAPRVGLWLFTESIGAC